MRLRIRARCSVLSNLSSASNLFTETGRLNVPTVTVASRNGVCNIGSFLGTNGGCPRVEPVVNYRVCIAERCSRGLGSTSRGECCRLVLLTGGCRKCEGLVGVYSVKRVRNSCCNGPEMDRRILRRCRSGLVYYSTYLTKTVSRGVLTKSLSTTHGTVG